MKINLNVNTGAVPTFAKKDPMREAAEVEAFFRGVGDVAQQIDGALKTQRLLRADRELQEAGLQLEEAETREAQEFDARPYISGDELERDSGFQGQTHTTDADGRKIPKLIPRWEVEPYMKRSRGMKNLQAAADGITDTVTRRNFLARGKEMLENRFQQEIIASAKEGVRQSRIEVTQLNAELQRQGKHDSAKALIADSSLFTQNEKTEFIKDLEVDRELHAVNELELKQNLSIADVQEINQLIDKFDVNKGGEDDYKGPLSQEERAGAIRQLKMKLKQDTIGKSSALTTDQIANEERIRLQIQTYKPGDTGFDITAGRLKLLADNGDVSKNGFRSLLKELNGKLKNVSDVQNIQAQMTLQAKGGVQASDTKENREAANGLWDQTKNRLMEQDELNTPQQALDVTVAHIKSYGLIPDEVLNDFSAANTGSIDQLMYHANLYGQIRVVAPGAMKQLEGTNFDTVRAVHAMQSLGYDQTAIGQQVIAMQQTTPEQQKQRNDHFKQMQKDDDLRTTSFLFDSIEKQFSTLMPFDSEFPTEETGVPEQLGLPLNMTSEYAALVQAKYLATGNMNIAKEAAKDQILEAYQIVNYFDNNQWMKHPPVQAQ